MAWAVTRAGVMGAGLYDENIFPGYYEDDDILMRLWLAGLRYEAEQDITIRHGDGFTYVTGTLLEDKTGVFKAEMTRSRSREYYITKWVPLTSNFDRDWHDSANRVSTLSVCKGTVYERPRK